MPDVVVVPAGVGSLAHNQPPQDVTLIAPKTSLIVRKSLHPALQYLLQQAAIEIHSGPGAFHRSGQFPAPEVTDLPLSEETRHLYKSGPSLLQQYLPFWAATLVDRMIVMLVPLIAVLIPLVKFAPALYAWRVRSRIYRRYGELKFLEAEIDADPGRHTREEWLAQLGRIEADVARVRTPLAFSDMLYTLRSHIGLVREVIQRKAVG